METVRHFRWSGHASKRAAERFPEVTQEEIHALYGRARRAGKKTRRKIKAACPAQGQWMDHGYQGRYIMVHLRSGIVYVMAAVGTCTPILITVFPLPDWNLLDMSAAVLAETMMS